MAQFKLFIAVFTAVFMILSLSSCKKNIDTDVQSSSKEEFSSVNNSDNETENTVYEFSKDKLFEVNSISEILKTHKSVKIIDKHDGTESIEQYFFHDGKPVFVQKWTSGGDDSYSLIEGWIQGYFIEYADGEYYVSVNVNEPTDDTAECPYDGVITNVFSEYEIELSDETEDSFVLDLKFEGQSSDVIHKCTVNKKTHEVTNIYYETGDGYTAITEYVYGEEVEDYGITQGFDNTKTVTMHIENIENGEAKNKTVTYTVPSDWILTPSLYDDYTLYTNAEYNQLFEYPGHNTDYTIYATQIKG